MAAAASFPVAPEPSEQRMLLRVGWKEYMLLRDLLDGPGLKMTYLRGALELMSPSSDHELWKKNIARMIELIAHIRGVDLRGYGSTTFKREAKERGAEADECYLVGHKLVDYPEIVPEVIYRAPLLNKLDVYSAMGIAEVWVYERGKFQVWRLGAEEKYEPAARSTILPGVDLELLARFAPREDTAQALRELEREVRASGPPV
jgi:Uma2 family endonuclease